ncbi:5-deoxy-glucuronate isomerase [Lentzea sp. PSKA42]|uniref:5-deoxy-glucuronate isomerase n=1 Tax=Lentzea indica TaxID=2604800 RepID=A0ABX1F9J8_9PSEU|nr:5-deoxy-glucuronate isomerase [Lentzea indica]NKE55490.1 5-deoxy-glucuronate isomerase [Lentzea indica]
MTMRHARLRVLELDGAETITTGDTEMLVLPLSGACVVTVDGERFELTGRGDVFDGVTDFAYLPRDAKATVTGRGRIALPSATAGRRLPARYGPAEAVPVELRGAGTCSRQVHNYCMPGTFEADKLMVCEVLTPGGNWSSYPPHRHDGIEEIYYFEVVRGGMAYQRVYGSTDVLAEVRTGDVVLIPHGWHGPSMAAPGYDLYYLNVMAGPGPRAWEICDDPAHAWVRDTWKSQPVDPRLPFGGTR